MLVARNVENIVQQWLVHEIDQSVTIHGVVGRPCSYNMSLQTMATRRVLQSHVPSHGMVVSQCRKLVLL